MEELGYLTFAARQMVYATGGQLPRAGQVAGPMCGSFARARMGTMVAPILIFPILIGNSWPNGLAQAIAAGDSAAAEVPPGPLRPLLRGDRARLGWEVVR